MWHLILGNLLIIILDIALLGIQYGGDHLFYLQGAFKPCVYGIKLKVEFLVLNRLIESISAKQQSTYRSNNLNSGTRGEGAVVVGVSSNAMQSGKFSRQRSSDIITQAELDNRLDADAEIGLEPMERRTLSSKRSDERVSSLLEGSTTAEGDGRLYGKPTEPWDGTKDSPQWRR
jgi:hypothetical protein